MKRSTIILPLIATLLMSSSAIAQTTYTIPTAATTQWSAVLPSTCDACTITIPSGSTLAVNESVTCQNCTFSGGTLSISSERLNIQYAGSLTTTNFNGTTVLASGTSQVIVNAPLSLTNASFTFSNTSSMTTSYNVSLSASKIYLDDNSSMTTNGGSSTTIDLSNSSQIVIGNATTTTTAIFTVSGPTLNLYDKSGVALENQNSVYYNWSNYNYASTSAASGNSYASSGVAINCGAGYTHKCTNPSVYGPATLSAAGVVPGVTLPIVLTGFSAVLNNDHGVTLDWNTQEEVNFSHFIIERSADGKTWDEIGTVEAKGNSEVETAYTYVDGQPLTGTNFYRLTEVNLDNSYIYSPVVVVRTTTLAQITLFPNPASNYINVSLAGNTPSAVTVLLTSAAGQRLAEKQTMGGAGTIVTIPVENLVSGLYIITVISADGSRESSPVLVSRS
jgi:Secretion system C-terminal sorting domain